MRKRGAYILISAMWIFFSQAVLGQTGSRAGLLLQLQSQSPEVRSQGFYALLGSGSGKPFDGETSEMKSIISRLLAADPGAADRTRQALIQLLSIENGVVKSERTEFEKNGKTLTEEYVNYYGDLIAAVSSLDDVRSVDALLGAITTGGMATQGLVRLGEPAFHPTIAVLSDQDPIVRSAAVTVLSGLGASASMSSNAAAMSEIKNAVRASLKDTDPNVRIAAIRAALNLRDPSIRPLIKDLADEDPYKSAEAYPVRDAAGVALQKW